MLLPLNIDYPTNTASVHLVIGCPNARASVVAEKKNPLEQPSRATQSLINTTSGLAVDVALVVPILVG